MKVAVAISDPQHIQDRQVYQLCVRALWRQIVPEGHPDPPDDVILAASKQVYNTSVSNALQSWCCPRHIFRLHSVLKSCTRTSSDLSYMYAHKATRFLLKKNILCAWAYTVLYSAASFPEPGVIHDWRHGIHVYPLLRWRSISFP